MYTILMDVGSKYEIDRPFPMKSPPQSRDPKLYCHFHSDIGHDTKECKSLKRALDGLAAKGFLKNYISRNTGGGLAAGGPTMRGQKDYAKRLGQVMLSGKATADPFLKVEIGEADRGKIATPHDDLLVIELKVGNLRVRRILVDTGSSSDIISLECLNRLQHNSSKIEKIHYPIIGFGGSVIHPAGIISLPLRMGNKKESRQMDVHFLIVKDLTAYNIILGRPTLNRAKAAIVTHLMLLKFVCDDGSVSTMHGDQQQARDCYLTTLSPEAWGSGEEKDTLGNKRQCGGTQSKSLKETLTISAAHMEERRPEPVGAHFNVVLNTDKPERVVPIGIPPDDPLAVELVHLLREFEDIFAFTVEEMPGIDPAVAVHKLNVDPNFKPYPDWVANVVLVKKPNGAWRMCVDYNNLNKACPKETFPLPKVDRLVDSMAGHAMMSFMDAYSGFHQIPLWPDARKRRHLLQNKRLINTVFTKRLGRNIESYIDDMIVKRKQRAAHIADLRETFETVRAYTMRLNPKKCVFGVTSGKFLGFLIDERGIEANPDKIQAVIDMSSPKTVKEVQWLTGHYFFRAIRKKAGDKWHYFFRAIRKKAKFEWSDKAEAALVRLKDHLHTLPRLLSPLQGETLYMYLAVSEHSLSAVLLTEREGIQMPVYFVSHVLHNAEIRYPTVEKFGLALFMASKKLRPYFLAHRIMVYTDQPLKLPFTKLEALGRLNWAIELNAFDITYEPRKAVKGQACEDFIVEKTRPVFSKNTKTVWTLYVDEAGAEEILALSDSQLIVSQVNGTYEARDPTMIKYMQAIHQEVEQLKSFEVRQVPRSENNQADALSTLASSASCDTPRHVFWEVMEHKSVEQMEVETLDRTSTWMDDIINFKLNGVLPEDSRQAKKLQKKCSWGEMWNGTLYKKAYSRPLLRCVTPEKGQEILEDLHHGLCSSHIGGRALAEKAL
ncbi:uncharacterized protein [Spinacia oleracea]|uniref:Reverse transcriptase n=1 Tax=Spinacia oleracea TaxID=3562 RepID=A0ABM3RQ86_SPIOL|nr:uncharacterized protein LOC130471588 [Spinacia oleracea]